MTDFDKLFEREFKATLSALKYRREDPTLYRIEGLPNPLEGLATTLDTEVYEVKGFPEGHDFAALNGTEVYGMGKGESAIPTQRFIVKNTGERKLNLDGSFALEAVRVPSTSLAVRTDNPVKVHRKKEDLNDNDYIIRYDEEDFPGLITDDKRFVYKISKEKLYRKYPAALAVSSKRMRAYEAYRVHTWMFGVINIQVIPYNPTATYLDTVILGTKFSTDFSEEIAHYLGTLVEWGFVPSPELFKVDQGYRNLVYEELEAKLTDYTPVSTESLAEGAVSYAQAGKVGVGGADDGSMELDDSWESEFVIDEDESAEGE